MDSLKWGRVRIAKLIGAWLALALAILAPVCANAQDPASPEAAYRLLPGDEVTLRFPLNSELDAQGPIGPDGRFSVPLLGRVVMAGLTLDEAEQIIDRALFDERIVANARASLSVDTYAGVVYVGGEVAKPGAVPITRALNPVQAITEAGGLLNTAKAKRIAVIRPNGDSAAVVQTVNMRQFVKSGLGDGALRLRPGDIVFVPKSTIAEINVWLDQHINQIIPDALNLNWNFGDFGPGAEASVTTGTSTGQ